MLQRVKFSTTKVSTTSKVTVPRLEQTSGNPRRLRLITSVVAAAVMVVASGYAVDGHATARELERAERANSSWASRLTGQASAFLHNQKVEALAADRVAAQAASREIVGQISAVDATLGAYPNADRESQTRLATARDHAGSALSQLRDAASGARVSEVFDTDDSITLGRPDNTVDGLVRATNAVRIVSSEVTLASQNVVVSHTRAGITAVVNAGEETLAATEGRVDDNAVRQALRDSLDTAKGVCDSMTFDSVAGADAVIADVQAKTQAVNEAVTARDLRIERERKAAQISQAGKAFQHKAAPGASSARAAVGSDEQPSPSGTGGARAAIEARAAALGVQMVWTDSHNACPGGGSTVGCTDVASQTITLAARILAKGESQAKQLLNHEAAHVYIVRACPGYYGIPPIVGNRVEGVTDAYADLFLGGAWQSRASAGDYDIARAIYDGNCG